MKVLLMHPDRDFDPHQLLLRELRYRYRNVDRQEQLPAHGLELPFSGYPTEIDRRAAVKACRLRAGIEWIYSVTGHRACYQAAVVPPVEADPRAALPGLVLRMRRLIELLVVVNAET